MAYSSFTLAAARKAFQLERVNTEGLFSGIVPVSPSAHLITELERNVSLAAAIGTEKAKSELIVTDVLVELREHFERRISLFSGIDFNVDAANDLTGVCDFVVSLSSWQFELESPVIVLVEAKRDNLTEGFGQCAAEMVAAQRFNAEAGNDIPRVYGVVTSGTEWLFLKLDGQKLLIDMAVYPIAQCDKILGILASMVSQTA